MLGDQSPAEVAAIMEACFGAAPLPQFHDAAARERALATAGEQGFCERVEAGLADGEPIAALPYGVFRQYRRIGNRTSFEKLQRHRGEQIGLAATACWLGIDKSAYLNDLLWAECEATWWVMPAHENHGTPIDLRVALCGCQYAKILSLLGGCIEPEVRERLLDELHRRILRPLLDPAARHGWMASTNNWNAVCIGNVCIMAMLIETEPARLGRLIAKSLSALPNFVRGFAADGGCTEGPSYWRFGFGWFIRLAAALHDYTGGQIDIAAGGQIERICRYPLTVALGGGEELTFADAHSGYQDPVTVMLINRFHDAGELRSLCELREDGRPKLTTVEEALLYDGWAAGPIAGGDHFLPELGVGLIRSGPLAVGAKGGHNAEHHNHNDVGSFIAYRDGVTYLTDPGAPIYSARTFSDRRYESIFCNSFGHSVPVIDRQPQPPGREYEGTIEGSGLGGDGAKSLHVEFGEAYDVESIERVGRTIELAAGGRQMGLTDTFEFSSPPASVEEAFMTTHPADVADDGLSVTIRPEGAPAATLAAVDTPGRFEMAELVEESQAESRTGVLLRRIRFTPTELSGRMTLRFVLRFE